MASSASLDAREPRMPSSVGVGSPSGPDAVVEQRNDMTHTHTHIHTLPLMLALATVLKAPG